MNSFLFLLLTSTLVINHMCLSLKKQKGKHEEKIIRVELSKMMLDSKELELKVRRSPSQIKNVKPLSLYAISNVAMTNFNNYQYVGEIELGSGGQTFKVIFDTGSAWTWVASYLCDSCQGSGIQRFYKCFASDSCSVSQTNIIKEYGKGKVVGRLVRDRIKIGGLTAKEQEFTLITQMEDLKGLQFDGLVGLGFKTLSSNVSTVLDNFKNLKMIEKVAFSIYYNDEEDSKSYHSALIIGGYDTNLIEKNQTIHYCKVISNFYWNVQFLSIRFSGGNQNKTLNREAGNPNKLTSDSALIDSGTSLMLFPVQDFNAIFGILRTYERRCTFKTSVGQIVCLATNLSNFPNIYFNLCGKELEFKPEDYTSRIGTSNGLNEYLIGFSSIDLKSSPTLSIMGALFMKEYYTLFNQDAMEIGFVKAARFGAHLESSFQFLLLAVLVLVFIQH